MTDTEFMDHFPQDEQAKMKADDARKVSSTQSAVSAASVQEQLSEYEQARAKNMKRNKEVLDSLFPGSGMWHGEKHASQSKPVKKKKTDDDGTKKRKRRRVD